MQPKIKFNDAWESIPLAYGDEVIEFFSRELQHTHPLRKYKLFPIAKCWLDAPDRPRRSVLSRPPRTMPLITRRFAGRRSMRALFRLDGTSERHPAVELWWDEHQGPLGGMARQWFEAIRHCGGDVREVLHDGQPTACVGGAAFACVDAFRSHVNIGFFQGAELPDPKGLLKGAGKFMRHVKLRPGEEVNVNALSVLINAAYADVKARLAAESDVSAA